jgi:hypothetical protein
MYEAGGWHAQGALPVTCIIREARADRREAQPVPPDARPVMVRR